MGEVFSRRGLAVLFLCVILILLCILILIEKKDDDNSNNYLSGYIVHPIYDKFSNPANSSFNSTNGMLQLQDTVIYVQAFYSINGTQYQNFNLTGSSFAGNSSWINNNASKVLDDFGEGEHYIIFYSCNYNLTNESWNCHDNKWQLIIVNITAVNLSTDNITQNESINGTCTVDDCVCNNNCTIENPNNETNTSNTSSISNLGMGPIWCGLHAIHTNYSDGVMNIYQSADSVKSHYQCASTNDHDLHPSIITQEKWSNIINISNAYNVDNNFTYFFGMEWTTGRPDIHYISMSPSPTPKTAADSDFNTVAEVAEWLSQNQGIGQIAHPARVNQMDFSNPERYNETWIPLVEMKNYHHWHWDYYWNCSADSGCTTYVNPYPYPNQVANSTGWIRYGLDRGIHLGFSCGNDYHGALPFNPICFTGVVGVMNLSREEIYKNLKARHTWAAEQKTIIMIGVNNGSHNFTMGDIFTSANQNVEIKYIINASAGRTISNINLFHNGIIVNATNQTSANIEGSFRRTLDETRENYLFIEVIESNGKRAWTSPVWITYQH
jgi:hypothetical protein